MRFIFTLVLFSILIVTITFGQTDTTTSAEVSKPVEREAYLFGGAAFPYLSGSFKNDFKPSHSIGFGYGVSFEPGDLGYTSLYATVEYNKFKEQKDRIGKIYTCMMNFKGSFSPSRKTIAPYFHFGIGYMFYSTDSFSVQNTGVTNSAFAWSFGVGIEVPFSKVITAFVDGESMLGLNPTKQAFPLFAGIRFRL